MCACARAILCCDARARQVEGATKRVALGPFDEAALRAETACDFFHRALHSPTQTVYTHVVARVRNSRQVSREKKPLPCESFVLRRALGERDWTLLVNDAERHVPEVQQLRRDFGRLVASALHEWRHDDAMVSIATPGGGVGPHVDSSDVALLQARGRRRWAIETTPLSAAAALQRDDPSTGARCLTDFRPDAEWVLEPGDCLFVPARVPHDGQALGAAQSNAQDQLCVTVSLGIRGPSKLLLIIFSPPRPFPSLERKRAREARRAKKGESPRSLRSLSRRCGLVFFFNAQLRRRVDRGAVARGLRRRG